jgi:hypothetical protein
MAGMPGTAFLFGAGASYGSDIQGVPPLGAGLFDELRRFNPDAWGLISGDLATLFRSDFEEGIKSIAPHALAPLQRAMAAYFFEFGPLASSSLYVQLARRIRRSSGWSGAACTLNYERLLERSLALVGVRPFIGQPPPGRPGFELCLPHGCCHLFCDGARGTAGAVSLNGFAVQMNGPVSVIEDPQRHRARVIGDAFPPVMSYFEPAKRTTAGHSFIERQRTRWRELTANAKTIVIVGVRVRPHDDHVWSPIASSSAQVVYCGGPTGAPEYYAWASAERPGQTDRILEGHFREEFPTICSEAGL